INDFEHYLVLDLTNLPTSVSGKMASYPNHELPDMYR
ncbi:unnamed protein product, partial [Didymodactylos carnosus]